MRLESTPKWIKMLFVLSVVIEIMLVGLAVQFGAKVTGLDIIGVVILVVYILLILAMWLIGFLNRYLILKDKKWLANTISIFIPLSILTYFTWVLIWQINNYPEQLGTFRQNAFWIVPTGLIVVYFLISLILINRTAK